MSDEQENKENAVETPEKKKGNPLMQKGAQSLNPFGRKGKELAVSAKTKEDLFKAFNQAGGLPRLVKLIQERKLGKTKESKAKAARADHLFLELAFNVLPRMVPKETSIDIETKSVVFQFTNANPEEIRQKVEQKAIDIEITKEP